MSLFRSRQAPARKPRTRLRLDPMEDRTVMSVTATFDGSTLRVIGDSNANTIRIDTYAGSEAVMVHADGRYIPLGSSGFAVPARRIEVFAGAGNDTVHTSGIPNFRGSIAFWGGDGNDTLSLASGYISRYSFSNLYGEAGNDILVGGDGNDTLRGDGPYLIYSGGRDVLIGGRGADTLMGDSDEDLLIGGYTDFDRQFSSLNQIRGWWQRTDLTYRQRWQGLLYNWHGYTGPRLDDLTVHTDAHRDDMWGGHGMDYFYTDPNQDDVKDTGGSGETLAWIWR